MNGNGDAPNRGAGGVEPGQRPTLDCTRRRWLGWVLCFTVPYDVDRRDATERDARLRDLAIADEWWRQIFTTPVVELDAVDRDTAIDRYTDTARDADRIIRWLEGCCYACGN